jgi:N-methylhydantoinase A/oxoprolinase/acetone carboxylase beta subunit
LRRAARVAAAPNANPDQRMPVLLGIDTGGTYTDAVLLDEGLAPHERVVASAKALTTRHDLAVGIGEAVDAALAACGLDAGAVGLVSLSTTLATNALVEGQGESVCLVFIGFGAADLARAGLKDALRDDPVIFAAGGHTPMGDEQVPLDLDAIAAGIEHLATPVAGFAVASHFAVRNPDHEDRARDLIRARTGLPVTCSHELSAKLGGPKRALTSVLNARLIGLLHRLISAAEALLAARGITAPLMVVRGDGALVAAEFAKARPIETILSGPAASIIGAAWLTGAKDAVISDIGGTTTDIAILRSGRPRLDAEGATVGGWRTMVEAVAIYTHGLGGDSEVHLGAGGLGAALALGPRRLVPLSLIGAQHESLVHGALERQLKQDQAREHDGRFACPARGAVDHARLKSDGEKALVEALAQGPMPIDRLVTSRVQVGTLTRLVARGIVMLAGFTPSDAAHVLGLHGAWDGKAAQLGARLFARRRTPSGAAVAPDPESLCRRVVDTLTRRSAEVVLDAAFAEDGFEMTEPSRSAIAAAALDGHRGMVRTDVGLGVPVIGLGASAPTYYPAVANLLGTTADIPTHAGVANAIGAVVGRIEMMAQAIVSQPAEGRYRAHVDGAPGDFPDAEAAIAFALDRLRAIARRAAADAGAEAIEVKTEREDVVVKVEGRDMFVEARLVARATGRPRLEMH